MKHNCQVSLIEIAREIRLSLANDCPQLYNYPYLTEAKLVRILKQYIDAPTDDIDDIISRGECV